MTSMQESQTTRIDAFVRAFLLWKENPTDGNAYRVVHLMNFLSTEETTRALQEVDRA